MRYMFVINHYYPYSNSGGNVIRRIAECIAKDNEVIVYTMGDENKILTNDKYQFEIINKVKIFRGTKKTLHFFLRLIWRIISICKQYSINIGYYDINCQEIQEIIKKEKVDVVYGVCFPFVSLYCVSKVYGDFEKRAIYLDPYYSNGQYHKKKIHTRFKEEKRVLKSYDKIFINSALKNDYTTNIFKLDFINFSLPNIENKMNKIKKIDIFFNEKYINFVYTGTLYHDIRTPEYVLNVWKYLKGRKINGKLFRLYIIGNNDGLFPENYFSDWKRVLKQSVVFHDRIKEEEANYLCYNSDFLINIGNKIENQIPGKTIDYLSFCKPIIHFSESLNDLSTAVYEKYPLHISVYGKEYEKDAERIYSFVMNMQNARVAFDDIKKIYKEFTVEYVSATLKQ